MRSALCRYDLTPVQLANFWSKVDKSEGCWPWTASDNAEGYGRFWIAETGGMHVAHRISYFLAHGEITEGMEIDHGICNMPNCVNPEHLFEETPKVNTLGSSNPASRNSRKMHCDRGHEYTEETTYVYPNGKGKECRVCKRLMYNAWYARTKAKK